MATQETELAKPKQELSIRLVPLENTVVNTRTQEEHTILLRVYEFCGWRWLMGDLPT